MPDEVDITTQADFGQGFRVFLDVNKGTTRRVPVTECIITKQTANQDDPAARDTQEAARKPAGDKNAVYYKRQDKAIKQGASGAERRARLHIEPSPLSRLPGSIAAELPNVSGETPQPKPRLRYG